MKKFFHIFLVSLSFSLAYSCSGDKEKVIPRGDLAQIYAEMLVMDQWILSTYRVRQQADTSLVYEPIFQKYGYTTEDYRKSVAYYMEDPERYSRILRHTTEILNDRVVELKLLREEMLRKEKFKDVKVDFGISDCEAYLTDEPYIHYYDSLAVEVDSLTNEYELVEIHRRDTLYENLQMIVLVDSLAVKEPVDTLSDDEDDFFDESLKETITETEFDAG